MSLSETEDRAYGLKRIRIEALDRLAGFSLAGEFLPTRADRPPASAGSGSEGSPEGNEHNLPGTRTRTPRWV